MNQNQTLYQTIKETEKKHPNNNALLFMGKYIDYRTLLSNVDQLANGFLNLGIKKGDVVTLALPNVFESIFSLYALNKIGAVLQLLHPLIPVVQVKKAMQFCKSNFLIIMDTFFNHFKAVLDDQNHKIITLNPVQEFGLIKQVGYKLINRKKIHKIPYGDRVIKLSSLYIEGDMKQPKIDAKKTAFLLRSGGTSGEPKIIELSNDAINCLAAQSPYIMDSNDFVDKHMLAVLPMFHGFGLCMGIHGMLMHGGVDTLMPKFDDAQTIELIKKNQINFIIGVPSLFEALLRNPKFRMPELKHLHQAFVGGDDVSQDLKKRFDEVMEYYYAPARMLEGYGLTEVVTVCCVNTQRDNNLRSVGKSLPGIDMGIIDLETNALVGPDTPGQIIVTGPTMMNGYLNDETATKKTLIEIDGKQWIKTGDLGQIDKARYVYFKQRLKRIIKVSGVQVIPSELENYLLDFEEIQEVAIVAKPDQRKGSSIRLFIVWKKGSIKLPNDTLKALIKENISRYAVPSEIIEMKELPKTIVGKINIIELEKMD